MNKLIAKSHIGEEGTEQFSVETVVDGKTIKVQPIHDPFIRATAVTRVSRWDCFVGIFIPLEIRTQVVVNGSEGAQRAIMTLDPKQLAEDTEDILRERKQSRESSGTVGYFLDAPKRCG